MLALCEKVEPSGVSVHTPCLSFPAPYKKLYIGVSLCSGSMVLVRLCLHAHVHAFLFSDWKSLMLMVENLETVEGNQNPLQGNHLRQLVYFLPVFSHALLKDLVRIIPEFLILLHKLPLWEWTALHHSTYSHTLSNDSFAVKILRAFLLFFLFTIMQRWASLPISFYLHFKTLLQDRF